MSPRDDLADMQADLDKRLSIHEAICAERYEKIVGRLDEMKTIAADQRLSLASVVASLTEGSGRGRALREALAYLIAFASILAALYSGSLGHFGK